MTSDRHESSRIGIWGVQRSGKSSYFYALHVALEQHQFEVWPVGNVEKVGLYNRGLTRFKRRLYPAPTAGRFLQSGADLARNADAVPASAPMPPPVQDQEQTGDDMFAQEVHARSGPDVPEEIQQDGYDTIDGDRDNRRDAVHGEIEEDNILKLRITFPKTPEEIKDLSSVKHLPSIRERPSQWVNRTFEVWLPDHGGETWTRQEYSQLMQSMIKFYSGPEFKGFMFFFDPTFEGEVNQGQQTVLGVDIPYSESFSNFITGLWQSRAEGSRLKGHCAVILTKTDGPRFREYAVSAPRLSHYYPQLLAQQVMGRGGFNQLRNAFGSDGSQPDRYLKCFCTSSGGAAEIGANFSLIPDPDQDDRLVPGMLEPPSPEGVEESFLWLVSNVSQAHQQKVGKPLRPWKPRLPWSK